MARKGVKKRDLSDVELREILSEVVPLVRMDHVIPTSADTLAQAIRRGLVPTPPSHMIGSDQRDSSRLNAWVRAQRHSGLWVRPRLFMPYYEEIKVSYPYPSKFEYLFIVMSNLNSPIPNKYM